MITLSIALLGSTCLILTILSAVIKDRYSLLGTTLSALTGAFLLIFSMVVMNLSSAINALSLFVMIGLVFYMGSRLIENCKVDNVHVQAAIVDIFKIFAVLAFSFAIFSINAINIFATMGGVLICMGIGLILLATNKGQFKSNDFVAFVMFVAIGVMTGFSVGNILSSKNILCAVLLLVSALLFLIGQVSQYLIIKERPKYAVSTLLLNIAMILLVVAVFLY